jgi:hypothetical protein
MGINLSIEGEANKKIEDFLKLKSSMRNDKLLHFEVPTTEKTIQHLVDFFSMFHTMKYYPILFVR